MIVSLLPCEGIQIGGCGSWKTRGHVLTYSKS
jgi:hypothetical protein